MANTVGKLGLGRKDHVSTVAAEASRPEVRVAEAALRPREMAVEAAE